MKSFIKLSAVAVLAVSCLSYVGCSEAKDAGGKMMDSATEAGGELMNKAKEAGGDMIDAAKEAGNEMKDKVMGAGSEAKEAAADAGVRHRTTEREQHRRCCCSEFCILKARSVYASCFF